jgi:hypothetical protein
MTKQVLSLSVMAITALAVVVFTSPAAFAAEPSATDASNTGNDGLNADPFLKGPDPDFCISCTWPEGSPTYRGDNGG